MCFAVAVMTAGVRSTPGVLIVPLEDEFGWSRATISFALGINLLLFGAIGPFAAAVMDRFGARRTITLALAATAVSVVLTPAMSQPWQLVLLWGVVVGLSTGFVGGFLAAYIAGRWFRAREGFVVGLLTAANAAGQLVFLPTMASLVTHFGWRIMSLVLAGAVIVFLPLPALLMRNRPEDVGLRPYGDLGASRPDVVARGQSGHGGLPGARDGRAITRLLADCWRLFRVRGHDQRPDRHPPDSRLRRSWVERGRRGRAARGNRRLRPAWRHPRGMAQRQMGQPAPAVRLLWISRPLAAVSAVRLRYVDLRPACIRVVYGLDWIASAPPTVRLLTGVVGPERIGIMVAWITVIHQVGSASAAYLAGVLRIAFGTYLEAFIISGILLIAAAIYGAVCRRRRSRPSAGDSRSVSALIIPDVYVRSQVLVVELAFRHREMVRLMMRAAHQ